MPNLRVGLLGLGMMGRHHARVLRETEGVELVAIADPGGDPHGVAGDLQVLPTIEALICAGIHAAVVAVPTKFHEEAARKLATAKVHMLVEKPIAHTVEAGLRMTSAFREAGLVGAVGHIERFNPALQQLRTRIHRGDLGEIYQITTRRHGPFPGRISDVGVVKDLATHDIDLTSWLANSDYETVSSQTLHATGRKYEDLLVATGRLSNGIIINHSVNWISPIKERVTVVTGAKGTFVADTLSGDLTFYENGSVRSDWDIVSTFRGVTEGNVTRFAYPKSEPLKIEHQLFRDAVNGDSNQVVSLDDGLRTLRVAEAMISGSEI